ncbi:unnamed protein product, partial [Pylaiella littoralis]
PAENPPTKCGTATPPVESTYPFLKPAVCKDERKDKSGPKGQKCWYLGPALDHNRDCVRMLTEQHTIIITRNFTWRSVPSTPPPRPRCRPQMTGSSPGMTRTKS